MRYKFLKKDFTEAGYIEDAITRIALHRAATTDDDQACLLRMYFVVIVCYDEVHG